MRAVSQNCANCTAFDREHLVHHAVYSGTTRFPAAARCKAGPPPWHVVQDTDWCRAHVARPASAATLHEDNGA